VVKISLKINIDQNNIKRLPSAVFFFLKDKKPEINIIFVAKILTNEDKI
jgi:hypothetical protein